MKSTKKNLFINTKRFLEIEQSEWTDFEAINSFLTPFREATLEVCGDQYATISLVVPWYNEILDHIEKTKVIYKYTSYY